MAEELNTNSGAEQTAQEPETVTMTKAELDALLQREGDRRVSGALKKQEAKLKESEKLARMNESEKYEYELQRREEAIAEKERALALAENKAEASKILADKGLAQSLVEFVVAEDAEEMNRRIKVMNDAFQRAVKAEVAKRMGSAAPKSPISADHELTKADLAKMPINELQRFFSENPQKYAEIMKG